MIENDYSPHHYWKVRYTPRLRLKLNSIDDVKAEMARLYREGKAGTRDVSDVSRLANVLALLARMIEGSDLERRIAALEGGNDG